MSIKIIKSAIFAYLLTLTTLTNTVVTSEELDVLKNQSQKSAVVFIGDSRMVGMKSAIIEDIDKEREFFIAEPGEGYSWFKNNGKVSLKNIVSSHKDISDWTVVVNLGVNDLDNAQKYVDIYEDVIGEFINKKEINMDMYAISINPVDEKKCGSIKNSNIEKANYIFEKNFSKNDNIHYIDTNTYTKKIMNTNDGLHYSDSTYRLIYRYLLKSISKDRNAREEYKFARSLSDESG